MGAKLIFARMNWAKTFFFLGVLFYSLSGVAQTPNNFNPISITNSTKSYLEAISLSTYSPSGKCPPKIIKGRQPSKTFLDEIAIPDSLTTAFFNQVSTNSCAAFYYTLAAYQMHQPMIDSIFHSFDLPHSYTLIPLALSGANPTLQYQTDKSGLWQLNYMTARKNGLQITAQFDERFHAELSTIAAAKHLKFLQKLYVNNHVLVTTAFYTSVPFVNSILHSHPKASNTSFYSALPQNTQDFLAYYKAWTEWFHLFQVPNLRSVNAFSSVSFSDTISFSALAQFITVTEKQLALANPVWVTGTYYPNMPYEINLPANQAKNIESQYEAFITHQAEVRAQKEKELAEIKKKLEEGIPDLNKYHAVTYKVKQGDVLGKIAGNHHVKVSQIKQWNNLRSDRIDIGQELTIYVENNATPPPAPPAEDKKPKKPVTGIGTPQIYTVKSGESLWLIAKKFPGVSAENIMEWNGISDKIDVGQQLKIYQP